MGAEFLAADRPVEAPPEPTRVPFNAIDEVVHLLDTETAPWSIQLEVGVAGRLDDVRLAAALQTALHRHPMARARRAATRRTRRRDVWEIPATPDIDPLRVVDCPDDEALSSTRARLQSLRVPLAESPPLRAVLAHHRDGDVLMLNYNHAATDGFGGLRFLHSVARAYRHAPDPVPGDPVADRALDVLVPRGEGSARVRRWMAVAEKLRDVAAAPARIASDHGHRDEPGYGFHHVRLDVEETRRLALAEHPGSVNDLLLTALHLAVADWNARHGKACRRVAVLVPSNLRPPDRREEGVGNLSLPARISTGRRHRSMPAAALATVTAQTTRKKRTGLGTGLLELLRRSHHLPLWAKEALVALVPLGGHRLVDTAILSNLGRLDDPPWFGDDAGETLQVWFSAPARMPLGVSVGAVTASGCLHLAFRYRRRLLSPEAVDDFAGCYLAHLRSLVNEHRPRG